MAKRNIAEMSLEELILYEEQLERKLSEVRSILNGKRKSAKFSKPRPPEEPKEV